MEFPFYQMHILKRELIKYEENLAFGLCLPTEFLSWKITGCHAAGTSCEPGDVNRTEPLCARCFLALCLFINLFIIHPFSKPLMSTYYVAGHGSLSPSQVHCWHLLSLSVDWIQDSVELQMSDQPLTLQSNTVKITLKNSLRHLGIHSHGSLYVWITGSDITSNHNREMSFLPHYFNWFIFSFAKLTE